MWYLLYDRNDKYCFELFHDDAPNSTTYGWFNLADSNYMFGYACPYKYDVHTWISDALDYIFIFHSFPSKPTQDEVVAVIHSHPELLI